MRFLCGVVLERCQFCVAGLELRFLLIELAEKRLYLFDTRLEIARDRIFCLTLALPLPDLLLKSAFRLMLFPPHFTQMLPQRLNLAVPHHFEHDDGHDNRE